MPIHQTELGPGKLDIGEVGTLTSFAAQLTACELVPEAKDEDDVYVLSGEVADGGTEETWTLEGTLLQDFGHPDATKSLSEWTFTNRGKVFPFEFVPNNTGNKKITGRVKIAATRIGGDVKKRNDSDFKWRVYSPELATNTPTP